MSYQADDFELRNEMKIILANLAPIIEIPGGSGKLVMWPLWVVIILSVGGIIFLLIARR